MRKIYILFNTGKMRLSSTSLNKIKDDPNSYKSIKEIFEITKTF